MLKALLMSDIHFEKYISLKKDKSIISKMLKAIISRRHEFDVLLLLGDIGTYEQVCEFLQALELNGIRTIYVHGNHEAYGMRIIDVISGFRKLTQKMEYVTYLENSLHTIEKDDKTYRFYGGCMWSNYSNGNFTSMMEAYWGVSDFSCILDLKGINGVQETYLFHQDYVKTLSLETCLIDDEVKVDVMLSHFIPHPFSIHPRFRGSPINDYFCSNMEKQMVLTRCNYWFNGHGHDEFDYEVVFDDNHKVRIVANPMGYPHEKNIKKFNYKIIEIKKDNNDNS